MNRPTKSRPTERYGTADSKGAKRSRFHEQVSKAAAALNAEVPGVYVEVKQDVVRIKTGTHKQ